MSAAPTGRANGSSPARDSRHRAREAAVQMLYQWEVGRIAIGEIVTSFWSGPASGVDTLSDAHRVFAVSLARGVADNAETLDPVIQAASEHWRVDRMNVLDRLILRLAVYEFLHESETPAKVVINEALDLARTFSGDEAVRFINGVLDAIRREQQRA